MNETNIEKIPHNCVLQLQAVYDSLKTAEKNGADYLLENPEKVIDMGIVDFAREAGCSEATIVRLSKKLGYDGFPELKKDFQKYLHSENYYEYENITKNDSPFAVLKKVFESSVSAIQDTLELIDPQEFEAAVEAIIGAENIMFCGVGDAAAVAMEAYQRFVRIGQKCSFSFDSDVQLILASQLKPGDVFIAISHSGRSKTVVEVLKAAKDKGATAISITNFPVSPLSKTSDIILRTAVFLKSAGGEVMAKRLTALCIIESLYIYFLFNKGGEHLSSLDTSNEVVQINKI